MEAGAGGTMAARGWMDRAGFWPLAFVGYFLFQAVWRRATGGALGLDEAQIILDGRRLAWGYGRAAAALRLAAVGASSGWSRTRSWRWRS